MDAKRRAKIEARMEKARAKNDCTLASSIVQELQGLAERAAARDAGDRIRGAPGWSKDDNALLIRFQKETNTICEK